MQQDFIATEPPVHGVQRLLGGFHGHAYDPHRHETYAVGATLSGAQGFRYRGAHRVSSRGESMVLHPDELHDGRAEAEGFVYRMIYVDPARIAAALGGNAPLPFVPEAVAIDHRLASLVADCFASFPEPLDPLAADGFIADLAGLLAERAGLPLPGGARPLSEMARVKELLDTDFGRPIASADLERISGLDRFQTARQFRSLAGTSPHRYLVGRRLSAAHGLIASGAALSDIAASVGFADQSHLTRAFKARYGLTPGRFRALLAAGGANRA